MKKMGLFSIAILVLVVSKNTAAQASHCVSLYEGALRNISITDTSFVELNQVFDEYCESSGQAKSSSWGASLDVVAKKIPIKFGASGASSREKVKNFCKNYESTYFMNSNVHVTRNTVVTEALDLANDCLALESKGVKIEHDDALLTNSVITVSFTGAVNYELQGVSTGRAIGCSYTDQKGKEKKLKSNTRMGISENFTIHCARVAEDVGDGQSYYPRTGVTLGSNQGPISFIYPAEEIIDIQYATQIARRLDQAESRIGSLIGTTNENRYALGNVELNTGQCTGNRQWTVGGASPMDGAGCPPGWKDTGGRHWTDFPGGPAGVGNSCNICYRVKYQADSP